VSNDDRRPRRARKVTSAESPTAMVRRARALLEFCERFGLDRALGKLLNEVLEGHRGPKLAEALGLSADEVDELERRFREATDQSVYEAAVDVLSAARRDSSIRPPPPPEE